MRVSFDQVANSLPLNQRKQIYSTLSRWRSEAKSREQQDDHFQKIEAILFNKCELPASELKALFKLILSSRNGTFNDFLSKHIFVKDKVSNTNMQLKGNRFPDQPAQLYNVLTLKSLKQKLVTNEFFKSNYGNDSNGRHDGTLKFINDLQKDRVKVKLRKKLFFGKDWRIVWFSFDEAGQLGEGMKRLGASTIVDLLGLTHFRAGEKLIRCDFNGLTVYNDKMIDLRKPTIYDGVFEAQWLHCISKPTYGITKPLRAPRKDGKPEVVVRTRHVCLIHLDDVATLN